MEENSKLCARASAKSSLSAVVPSQSTPPPPPQTYDIFTNNCKQTQIEISTTPRSNETRMCEISESAGKVKANCIQRSAD